MPDSRDFESYGKGHRTFDCPWCGAISGVDPSHLGESFECPECQKRTKLTAENTRGSPVTEAPDDAPPVAASSKTPLLVGVVGIAVVVIAAIIVFAGGGGDDGSGGSKDPVPVEKASTPAPPPEPADPPENAPPDEGAPPPDEAAPADTDPPDEGTGPDETQPAEPPPEEAAPDPVEEAKVALERAEKALADWQTAHPGEMEVLRLRQVGVDLGEQVRVQLGVLGEGEPTPDGVRSFNDALRAFIAEDEERIRVAAYLVRHLDRDGIKPHLLPGWEAMNFYAPRVRETLLEVCGAWGGAEIKEYSDLQQAVVEARRRLFELGWKDEDPKESDG